ncbi:ABC-2 family transporter protein [Marininema mesophilum]|uniref:ABC-2 family transporter protein n=1 Tax=Marininema mesophilum TaxID=1048340 RepID=A0A1H2WJN1_9BACL|nr:ABC transporter permease [Marininema mesophilum]SDW80686.1 ABC-2 family transporter protein [Marininema mesophilum]
MISLIASEWQRIWSRKITWILFAAIPLVLFVTGHYYQGLNDNLKPDSPEFALMDNFPILALAEQLLSVFNMTLLLLLVFSITEEYRTGQLRMVMIRSYTFTQLFFAKWINVMIIMFLFNAFYFLLSYAFGSWMFDSSSHLMLFLHDDPVSNTSALLYNLRYYGFAFLTLIAISAVITFFAVISQTTTTAIGLTLGYLLVSVGYSQFLHTFTQGLKPAINPAWYFLSLTEIQYQGIALALADEPKLLFFNAGVLLVYTLIFGTGAYLLFTKKDRFI